MKKYCMECGYGNEYTGTVPEKCSKCGTSFASVAKETVQATQPRVIHQQDQLYQSDVPSGIRRINGIDIRSNGSQEEDFEDSEFDTYMEGEPEPVTERELGVFLKDTAQAVKFTDMVKAAAKDKGETPVKKTRGRPRKKK